MSFVLLCCVGGLSVCWCWCWRWRWRWCWRWRERTAHLPLHVLSLQELLQVGLLVLGDVLERMRSLCAMRSHLRVRASVGERQRQCQRVLGCTDRDDFLGVRAKGRRRVHSLAGLRPPHSTSTDQAVAGTCMAPRRQPHPARPPVIKSRGAQPRKGLDSRDSRDSWKGGARETRSSEERGRTHSISTSKVCSRFLESRRRNHAWGTGPGGGSATRGETTDCAATHAERKQRYQPQAASHGTTKAS